MNNVFRLFITICLLLPLICTAQCKTGNFPHCKYSYRHDGRKSASPCYDKAMRYGVATVYDGSGKVVYSKQLRYHNGSSLVSFRYYTTGAVSRAEWHDNYPDGRWFSSVTFFSPAGSITHVKNENCTDTARKWMQPKSMGKTALPK